MKGGRKQGNGWEVGLSDLDVSGDAGEGDWRNEIPWRWEARLMMCLGV